MKAPYAIQIFLGFLILSNSCSKDEDIQDPVIHIEPSNLVLEREVGDEIIFIVNVNSNNILDQFRITLVIESIYDSILVETIPGVKEYEYQFVFEIPEEYNNQSVLFEFLARDNMGNSTTTGKKVVVTQEEILLTESAGHKMFVKGSNKGCAYNLETGLLKTIDAPSVYKDIQDNPPDSNFVGLSRTWSSPSYCLFVKYNGFNYSNATNHTAKSGYEAGEKLNIISGIQEDDIYIARVFKWDIEYHYVVIKIISCHEDTSDIANNYYLFNIKKLPQE